MFTYNGISFHWLGHDGFLLEKGSLKVYFDPFKVNPTMAKPASLVFISHEHFDHCSIEDLQRVVTPSAVVVCPHECLSALSKVKPGSIIPMRPGETLEVAGVKVKAVPAYNLNKYRDLATKLVFHPKQDEKNGYVVTIDGTSVYHAGDTDFIPEMKSIACDVVLLPVSGTYVMTAQEAADAARALKPKVTIPMHYGSIVGKESDGRVFAELLKGTLRVEVLQRE
jgi:L-ascorbate metabolism protein UlaG (beta-lactamase superfamily)